MNCNYIKYLSPAGQIYINGVVRYVGFRNEIVFHNETRNEIRERERKTNQGRELDNRLIRWRHR